VETSALVGAMLAATNIIENSAATFRDSLILEINFIGNGGFYLPGWRKARRE
jgi:hypothetical protein